MTTFLLGAALGLVAGAVLIGSLVGYKVVTTIERIARNR